MPVTRRARQILLALGLVASLGAVAAPAASAQQTADFGFEHDDSLDGTPAERQSGFFQLAGVDPAAPPPDQRATLLDFLEARDADNDFTAPPVETLFEVFEFEVAPDEVNGSFTAELNWGNPNIDFDMYIYRRRPNGTLDPQPVAQSATGDPEESATYVSPRIDSPVEPGTYAIFVDNWCSSDTDPVAVELYEDVTGPICDIGPYEDEDDFTGRVEFAPLVLSNRLPTATLSGPTTGRAGDRLTFTAGGSDSDGQISRYTFDLDGDGNFEYDNASNPSVTQLFTDPGFYNVGVRVIDDRSGLGYASLLVTILGPAAPAPDPGADKPVTAENLLSSFRLNRPVFGGKNRRKLVVRYRLRDDANVDLRLYRSGKRIRRLAQGERVAGKLYKQRISPRGLRRGSRYTIRLVVKTDDGRRDLEKLKARRL